MAGLTMRATAPLPRPVLGKLSMRWRVLFAVLFNLAAWTAIIWGASRCL